MVKPEWGTKRTCPKCATRFYDLGKEDPVTCINCSVNWYPEPVLKSKQPLPYEVAKPEKEVEKTIVIVRDVMESAPHPAVSLHVPLQVDARAANNWEEAH